jgi:hypothetical protein
MFCVKVIMVIISREEVQGLQHFQFEFSLHGFASIYKTLKGIFNLCWLLLNRRAETAFSSQLALRFLQMHRN